MQNITTKMVAKYLNLPTNSRHVQVHVLIVYAVTDSMQAFFYKEFAEAKKHIPEPPQPKLKLKTTATVEATPKITLRVGAKAGEAATPTPQTNTPSAIKPPMDSPSTTSRRNPLGTSQASATPVPNLAHQERGRSTSGSAASPVPLSAVAIKNEDFKASNSTRPTSSGPPQLQYGTSMLPPGTITPGMTNDNAHQNGQAQTIVHQPPNLAFESKWRQPGKSMFTILAGTSSD